MKIRVKSGHKGILRQSTFLKQWLGMMPQPSWKPGYRPAASQLRECPEMAPPMAVKDICVFNRIRGRFNRPKW